MQVTDGTNNKQAQVIESRGSVVLFSSSLLQDINNIFDSGATLKYLSETIKLSIPNNVMNCLGTSITLDLKGASPPIRLVESSFEVSDLLIAQSYGSMAIFTPAQFWNNITKVLAREIILENQNESILGDDTFGIVFLVERLIKDSKKRVAVNLYRESWKSKTEFSLSLSETGGTWERGHYFVIKVSK